MEDYEEPNAKKKGAWNKAADHVFRLHLKSYSDPDTAVTLEVTMTATYPKTAPLLSVTGTSSLRQNARSVIENLTVTMPKELLGSEMIYEIATSIQDVLEDDYQRKQAGLELPSLEEERVNREAKANKLALEQEEQVRRKKEEEDLEEERVLQQMLEEELARRKGKAREMERKTRPSEGEDLPTETEEGSDAIVFDQSSRVKAENGDDVLFRAVFVAVQLKKGPVTEVSLVNVIKKQKTLEVAPLILKSCGVRLPGRSATEIKRDVQTLEDELEALKKLRHSNVISLLNFKVDRTPTEDRDNVGGWEFNILTEFGNKGSILEVVDIAGPLNVDKVRAWTIQLLEAVDFFHRHGIIHKNIHMGNILICRSATGATSVKISDASYQYRLQKLKDPQRAASTHTTAESAYWIAPELAHDASDQKSRKTDIWDLGLVLLQMTFGTTVLQKHTGPQALMDNLDMSESFEDILRKFFKVDPKKRATAFELLPCEFLRTEAPILHMQAPAVSTASSSSHPPRHLRARGESSTTMNSLSRYVNDFVEESRLGKGGFGEVVKARNKLDGRFYAIKKIRGDSASLSNVLHEVMLLSRLNHPYVVRYFTAWTEENFGEISETDEEAISTTETSSVSAAINQNIDFVQSTGGLDFISSSGYPKIEFEYDSDDYSESGSEEEEDSVGPAAAGTPSRRKSLGNKARPVKTTLYIQMEYCERHTLRDLIRHGIYKNTDECWRLFRQVLDGLCHIHSHGIIHRDLKPDNVFIDMANNPRLGDFGLATTGIYQLADKSSGAGIGDSDLTRSIGTALYVAPELHSSAAGHYNDKVDMYSLGIIFFEMCFPLPTAMEREKVLQSLRQKIHALPSEFQRPEMALQGEIISSLINHRPSDRPSSAELLRSGKLPVQLEDETVRRALQDGLSDTDSPYYQKIMSTLFSQPLKQVKDVAWDVGSLSNVSTTDLLLQGMVKERLGSIFRRHGAVESQRILLFPRSSYYSSNVFQLLDSSGTLLQLPYDLTLPYARTLAKHSSSVHKTFAFGNVYRDMFTGGQPRSHGEVDFDIVSSDSADLALKEAEVIKVIDEIVEAFPSLQTSQMCFHLNHSDLLETIMEFCRISMSQRPAVKDILSKLNVGEWTWQKIRNELRAPSLGVSSTSLDDMARFDFRAVPDKAFQKLRSILDGSEHLERISSIVAHMNAISAYLKLFNVRCKVYISPLASFNDKFYRGGILFQCLYDTRRKDVFAAGGRYDHLIRDHRSKINASHPTYRAVGFNLGWERLYTSMSRFQKNSMKSFMKKTEDESMSQWATRRCDVLVASFDAATLRSTGLTIVQDLWANEISAELASDARSIDDLAGHSNDDKHSWIVILKQETGAVGDLRIKVRSLVRKEDFDIRSSELIGWLRSELRDREHREGMADRSKIFRQSSYQDNPSTTTEKEGDVRVLLSQHKGKKSNRRNVVEAAQSRAQELVRSFLDGPIAAIETRDEVLEALRETRLSDPDSWRKVIQSAPLAERKYLAQVHELMNDMANDSKSGTRNAFIYNFRTGACIYYDLGPSQ